MATILVHLITGTTIEGTPKPLAKAQRLWEEIVPLLSLEEPAAFTIHTPTGFVAIPARAVACITIEAQGK